MSLSASSNPPSPPSLPSAADGHTRLTQLLEKVKTSAKDVLAKEGDRGALTLLHHHLHTLAAAARRLEWLRLAATVGEIEQEVMAFIQGPARPEGDRLATLGQRIDGLILSDTPTYEEASSDEDDRPSEDAQGEVFNPRLIFVVDHDQTRCRRQGEEAVIPEADGIDPVKCRRLTDQLRLYGYQSQRFGDLESMAAAMQSSQPDAMVVDLDAPEGGLACMARLAEIRERCGSVCPVIFLATEDDLTVRVAAINASARAFFRKPVHMDRLVDGLDLLTARPEEDPFRVLIVDDDALTAKLHGMILQSAGLRIEIIHHPDELLPVLDKVRPELVLMDMYMPRLSGSELAAVMRQHEEYAHLPVVYLSAETDEKRQIEAIRQGGDDFLAKPVQPSRLISVVLDRAGRFRAERDSLNRDGVTGLLNYSAFCRELRLLLDQAASPLTMALLDITRFAEVNRRFGEAVGDRVLRRIAHLLRQHSGPKALLGRYEGDTFAIAFPLKKTFCKSLFS